MKQREPGSQGAHTAPRTESLGCCSEQVLNASGHPDPSRIISAPCQALPHSGLCPPLLVTYLHVVFSHLQSSSSHHRSQGTSGSFRALVPLGPCLPWRSHLAELPLVALAALQSKSTDVSVGHNCFYRQRSRMSKENEIQRRRCYQQEMCLPSGQACLFPPVFLVSLLVPRRAKKNCWNGKVKKSNPSHPLPGPFPCRLNPGKYPHLFPREPTRRLGSHTGKVTSHKVQQLFRWEKTPQIMASIH